METMRITEMKARNRGRDVRIFVSEMMIHECDDCKKHFGWWYCVKGGTVGYFVTSRPYSGVVLEGILAQSEGDLFNVYDAIDTKERFAKLITE